MKKSLIRYYQDEAERKFKALHISQKQLQNVIDAFCSLEEHITISLDELKSFLITGGYNLSIPGSGWVRGDKEMIKLAIVKKLLPDGKVGGMPVNLETVEQFIEFPSIDEVLKQIEPIRPVALEFLSADFFTLNAGEISIAENVEEIIRESFKIYIENETEQQRFEAAQKLADSLNDISQLLPESISPQIQSLGDLEMVLELDGAGQYIPNVDFIKSGNAGQYQNYSHLCSMRLSNQVKKEGKAPKDGFSDEYLDIMGLNEVQNEPKPITGGPNEFFEMMGI